MSYRWMPILGEFDVANEIITFEGREMPAPPEMPNSEASAAGIIVCDQAVLEVAWRQPSNSKRPSTPVVSSSLAAIRSPPQ